MRTVRGFHDGPLDGAQRVQLSEALSHHWTRVLRLQQGDEAQLFNGDGHDYRVRLLTLAKRGVEVEILGSAAVASESPLDITLAQGLCRGEKMDWVLQKATELGVSGIQPLMTERSEVRLSGEREERRVSHWRQVLQSACEQCGRARLPRLASPLALPEWAATADPAACKLLLDPCAEQGLKGTAPAGRVVIAIGPEGGFAEHEVALLQRRGFLGIRLGPRILRTETAGLAALAALQAAWGDLG